MERKVNAPPLPNVAIPDAAPIFSADAAPKAFTVVAVVLSKAKVVDAVVILVAMAGLVLNTTRPVPVSSVTLRAKLALDIEFVKAPPVVVVTSLSAVRPENVIVPALVMAVAFWIARPELITVVAAICRLPLTRFRLSPVARSRRLAAPR